MYLQREQEKPSQLLVTGEHQMIILQLQPQKDGLLQDNYIK